MFFLSFKFLAESLNSGGRRSRVRSRGGVTSGIAESGVIVADQVNNLCAAYRGWVIYLAGDKVEEGQGGVTGGVAEFGVIVADQVNNLCAAYRGWMIYLAGDNDEHQAGK